MGGGQIRPTEFSWTIDPAKAGIKFRLPPFHCSVYAFEFLFTGTIFSGSESVVTFTPYKGFLWRTLLGIRI